MSFLAIVLVVAAAALAWEMWSRIRALERSLWKMEDALEARKRAQAVVPEDAVAVSKPAVAKAMPAQVSQTRTPIPPVPLQQPRSGTAPEALRAPSIDEVIVRIVRDYFTGGNMVVRVGIIVLFFGVGFLLKYAAEHTQLSIEMRMAGVALGALALFAVGWALRKRRRGFALALQGGAVGILYLTLFAALQLYQLLPAGVALGLMAGLGMALCLLAVWQDSLALSMLGASGGFLAPVLASTGDSSHVALFSYYAMLNVFIVVQAWFKAWRPLNLLAFVFTFGVATAWGVMRYEPALFATTEPFLVFFFLAFIAIAVLFAHRTAPRLTHYVDGTLVFGTPVVAMALQMELVRDFHHGRAWSAAAAGAIYLLLAAWLQQTQRETLRLLKESFVAIGVAFLTLAVPLWLDDSWTSATWALEGAALMWVGLRQQRWLSTGSGVLLQLAAAVTYLAQGDVAALTPVANAHCEGALLLSVAGLISAYQLAQPNTLLRSYGQVPANVFLAWGLGWWLFAGGHEVQVFLPAWQAGALLLLCAVTALIAGALVRPLVWPALRVPALLILPVMLVAALAWSARSLHPVSEAGWLAWPAGFVSLALGLWWHESTLDRRLGAALHGLATWLLAMLIGWELHWQITQVTAPGSVWAFAAWGLIPAMLLAGLCGDLATRGWPLRSYPADFRSWVARGLAVLLLLWSLWLNVASDGAAAPLPYLPLLNPLDVAVGVALAVTARWLAATWCDSQRPMLAVLAAVTFFWLNAVLLRTMHHWGGVPYRLQALLADTAVQAALSIFWTLLALGAMLWASRKALRVLWFGGAGLMAVVVAKLFLVDLVRVGTVPRIVSFLVVGGLMLVIGYFSPLPPEKDANSRAS